MFLKYSGYTKDRIKNLWPVIGIIMTMIGILIICIWSAISSSDKLTLVITHNSGFWVLLFIALIFGLFRKLTNPLKFAWIELPVQLFVSFVVISALYVLFFSTAGNLSDTEIWNGYAYRAEYYEAWKEKVIYTVQVASGTDSKGNTTYRTETRTRIDHHSPSWKVKTTIGDLAVDNRTYRNYVTKFGQEQKEDLFHFNQVSLGDGNMFFTAHQGIKDDKLVPASVEKHYINYLKASDSIKKISGSLSSYQKWLLPYPRIYNSQLGPIEINRVLDAKVNAPLDWKTAVDKELDVALTTLGAERQVNVLVYLANTSDQGFAYALEEAWVKGKKNDVIVVIGATKFPKADFVYIMAWTEIEEFNIELRNNILGLTDLSDPQKLVKTITDQIRQPATAGGFVRRPMANLEYLIAGIKLPMWCQILIILIGTGASWLTSTLLIANKIEE